MAGLRILSPTSPLVYGQDCHGSSYLASQCRYALRLFAAWRCGQDCHVSSYLASQCRFFSCREHYPWNSKGSKLIHKQLRIVSALGGSSDEDLPGMSNFPRINVRDPYKRLGISREASEEEVREAHKYLIAQYGGHEKSRASIEAAHDKIIMESLKARRRSKSNLQSMMRNNYAKLPPWVRNLSNIYDVPSSKVILIRAAFFALLGVWSVLDQTQGGPAFQVAISLAGCIYFLNERLKSKWKAFFAGIGSFVIGWVLGSIVAPFLPAKLYPKSWSVELVTALISYVILWYSCTFFRSTARA